MFLRKRGTTWSGDLLRDELVHAGIRHCRTRLDAAPRRTDAECNEVLPPPSAAASEAGERLNG